MNTHYSDVVVSEQVIQIRPQDSRGTGKRIVVKKKEEH